MEVVVEQEKQVVEVQVVIEHLLIVKHQEVVVVQKLLYH